jgi:hypothetical protein
MAIPMIAAGIAARAIAKKLATRAAGGITGAGAKSVGSVYKEQGFSNSVLSRPAYTPVNSFGTGSVTKIPSITKNQQKVVNELRTNKTNDAKSGVASKNAAKGVEAINKLKTYSINKPPLKTVKINSNPTRAR